MPLQWRNQIWQSLEVGAGKRVGRHAAAAATPQASRCQSCCHIPNIAFRHLLPNSARSGYATEGALFTSAQLSTDAVSALRKVCILTKLQALVYDILPSTTAVFSYVTVSRKLSANEQGFLLLVLSGKFVTNNSDYIRRLFYS